MHSAFTETLQVTKHSVAVSRTGLVGALLSLRWTHFPAGLLTPHSIAPPQTAKKQMARLHFLY